MMKGPADKNDVASVQEWLDWSQQMAVKLWPWQVTTDMSEVTDEDSFRRVGWARPGRLGDQPHEAGEHHPGHLMTEEKVADDMGDELEDQVATDGGFHFVIQKS